MGEALDKAAYLDCVCVCVHSGRGQVRRPPPLRSAGVSVCAVEALRSRGEKPHGRKHTDI